MKEILKSKAMVAFIGILICFFYLNARDIQKMEVSETLEDSIYVAMNV